MPCKNGLVNSTPLHNGGVGSASVFNGDVASSVIVTGNAISSRLAFGSASSSALVAGDVVFTCPAGGTPPTVAAWALEGGAGLWATETGFLWLLE